MIMLICSFSIQLFIEMAVSGASGQLIVV